MSVSHSIANRFCIEDPERDLLGRGGMGEVYRATDTQTGETVAVKALNPEIVEHDSSLLERFVREGEALRQLNHPNIVHMIAALEEPGRHYLVMEYLEGGSVKDLLAVRGCLPANEVVKIALEVADALARAHHLGIIHRDLKPANVLLAKDGTPRLADFGIAHIQDSSHLTQSGVLVGTVDYLSPELCQGESPDERSDIWAFGVMLFEMLTGKVPFEGKSVTAKVTAILNQPVPDVSQLAPDVPTALVDLVYRMLEKDPQQRIPSVRMVAAGLEGIQKGRERPSKGTAKWPAFLTEGPDIEPPVFVTRESELAQLDRIVQRALEGHGQVVFLTGDPGQGKTALAQEYARRACGKYDDLVVAGGNCSAYTGIGDPYLPFREILGLLCGDIESRWDARAMSREQAERLCRCIPIAVQGIVESGRDLVDTLISGDTLIRRVSSYSSWLQRGQWFSKLEQLVRQRASTPADPNLQQAALFEEYLRVLRAIAREKPVLLIVEDLHWADSASINLLFNLGKRIEGSRIMFLGTYRGTEVALGRAGQRHPLEPILNEFKRQYGDIQIDLGEGDGRRFVDAFLDTEPNRLDENFRATLFRVAGGHPLGTIELLRDLQERGGLVQDASGRWVEGVNLNWDALPARVEAMIAERIERLDLLERRVLKAASVEGETFTAEVIAQVLDEKSTTVLSLLSEELNKRHHLVSAQNIREQNGKRLSTFRFQHILFQRYLYSSLDVVERSNLHQSVGMALKDLYAGAQEGISGQLARHFQGAGTDVQAAEYLVRAGDRARDLYAYQEAVDHYQEAQNAFERALGENWNPLQRAELDQKIGEVLYRKGDSSQALDYLKRALGYLGCTLPASRWGVRLAILVELLIQLTHRMAPRLLVKEAVQPSSPRVRAEMKSYETIGWIEAFLDPERMLVVVLRALNRSESSGFRAGIISGSFGLGTALDYFGLFRLAEGYHQRAVALAEGSQDPRDLANAYLGLLVHEEGQGELDLTVKLADKAANAFLKAGDLHNRCFVQHMQADAQYGLGRLDQSLETSKHVVMQGHETVDLQIQFWGLCAEGGTLRRLGEFAEAQQVLQQAVELGDAIQDYGALVEAGGELGRCLLRQGRTEQALRELKATVAVYNEHGTAWGNDIAVFHGLAEAYLAIADQARPASKANLDQAWRACREARAHARKHLPGMSEALRFQGTCEWLKGRKQTAQKRWEQSLKMAREHGQRYDEGVTMLEMGSRLSNRGFLERAIAILSEIGAQWDLEQAQKALRNL